MESLDELSVAFSKTSVVGLAILDDQLRFRFVNDALVAMHNSIPAPAFVGSTIPDILGEAGAVAETRLRRVSVSWETPATEVAAILPSRTELGYWVEKLFRITDKSGKVTQVVSLSVEVTGTRKLEEHFRKLASEPLWRNQEHQRLARELHDAIDGYHAAVGMNLNLLGHYASHPERIPELLEASSEFLDESIRRLTSVIATCFSTHRQH